jgi:hypothetical protein
MVLIGVSVQWIIRGCGSVLVHQIVHSFGTSIRALDSTWFRLEYQFSG